MAYAYIAAVVLTMLAIRVNVIESRSLYYRGGNDLNGATLGYAVLVAMFALLVYGFVFLDWYWPIIAFLVGSFTGMAITRDTFAAFYVVRIPLEIVAIVATVFFWGGRLI